MLNLFMIGTVDYTNNVINGSFDIIAEDVAITWTDANLVEHQDITRTRIDGSMNLMFRNEQEYNNFLANIDANKNREGQVLCTVKPNNADRKTNYFKLSMRPIPEQSSSLRMYYKEFALQLRER